MTPGATWVTDSLTRSHPNPANSASTAALLSAHALPERIRTIVPQCAGIRLPERSNRSRSGTRAIVLYVTLAPSGLRRGIGLESCNQILRARRGERILFIGLREIVFLAPLRIDSRLIRPHKNLVVLQFACPRIDLRHRERRIVSVNRRNRRNHL